MTRQNLPRATGRKTAKTQKRIFITTMPLTSTTHATRAATTNRAISTKTIMPRSANRNPMNIKMSALIAATIRRAIRTHRQATNPMHRAMTPAPPKKHLLILQPMKIARVQAKRQKQTASPITQSSTRTSRFRPCHFRDRQKHSLLQMPRHRRSQYLVQHRTQQRRIMVNLPLA